MFSNQVTYESSVNESVRNRRWYARYCGVLSKQLFLIGCATTIFLCMKYNGDNRNAISAGVFLPVWITTAIACIASIFTWYVTRPYVLFCIIRGDSTDQSPNKLSLIFDILPEIVISILGAIFLLLVFGFEIFLYFTLNQYQDMTIPGVCGIALFTMILLYGSLFQYEYCYEYIWFGLDGIVTILLALVFFDKSTSTVRQLVSLPSFFAFLGITVGVIRHYFLSKNVLTREEEFFFGIHLAAIFSLDIVWATWCFMLYQNYRYLDLLGFHLLVAVTLIVLARIGRIRSEILYGQISKRLERHFTNLFSEYDLLPGEACTASLKQKLKS